jgi:L-ascorbate metabolism protein UlaG (beta-lactamase superfamily)
VGTIYVDPFHLKEEPHDADFILITHPHYDHFSPEDIAKVVKDSTILVHPESMQDKAREVEGMVKELVAVKPGTICETGNLELETVPAYNKIMPFHPKSNQWVGYILKLEGKRVYIAGDSDETNEAKQVKCDIALLPIGGKYTMDAKRAAELVNIIKPEVVIPTHYGSIIGKPGDAKTLAELVEGPTKVVEKMQYFE